MNFASAIPKLATSAATIARELPEAESLYALAMQAIARDIPLAALIEALAQGAAHDPEEDARDARLRHEARVGPERLAPLHRGHPCDRRRVPPHDAPERGVRLRLPAGAVGAAWNLSTRATRT